MQRKTSRPHSLLEPVVDRADLELGTLERAEGALGLGEGLVRADDVGGRQLVGSHARAQYVDAVERRLRADLRVLATVLEALVLDREREVLLDLVAVGDLADG